MPPVKGRPRPGPGGIHHAAHRQPDSHLPQRHARARRRHAGGTAGHVWPARPQRSGQVVTDALHRDAADPHAGRDPFRRSRRARESRRTAPHPRLPAAGLRGVPTRHRARHARSPRGAQGLRERQGTPRDSRCAAAPGQPVGGAQESARRILGRHAATLRHRAGAHWPAAADHRRRAHRRPRSRRTQPLPQPAGRDRRERGRDPLDAHCRRRRGSLSQHGNHRRRTHRQDRRPTAIDCRDEWACLAQDDRQE